MSSYANSNSRSSPSGGEAIEAHADGLTALLLGQNVILLLLGIGEARAVSVRARAVASGRRRAGVVVGGSHFRD